MEIKYFPSSKPNEEISTQSILRKRLKEIDSNIDYDELEFSSEKDEA